MGDGSCIELFAPQADAPASGQLGENAAFMHIALTVADLDAALERVRQAGYQVTLEPTDGGLGDLDATIAFFCGPDGEVLEFWQSR
jgi:glyoxylase I family protein